MRKFDMVTSWIGELSIWKFVGILFLVGTAAPVGVIALFFEFGMISEAPYVAVSGLDVLIGGVMLPLAETFIAQFMVIWMLNRWVTKSIMVQILISAVIYCLCYLQDPVGAIYSALVGVVLAWAFCAYYYKFGFRRAFCSVALAVMLRNLLIFFVVYLDK